MTTKKVSLDELKNMIREAVALQLDKDSKKSASEEKADKKDDKAKAKKEDKKDDKKDDKKKTGGAFPGAAPPFGAKNEGVRKVTLEQLRGMVKEAVAGKLKEMGHEWGTEHDDGAESAFSRLSRAAGVVPGGRDAVDDSPIPTRSPEEKALAYNKVMGTHPSLKGWEAAAAEDLKRAADMLGRVGISKGGRAALGARIKELEDMLNVSPADRHFAGDRED